jgi:hypothetical protein
LQFFNATFTFDNCLFMSRHQSPFIAAYSANTAHIMAWDGVHAMFEGVAEALAPRDSTAGGIFFLYGPFNIDGQFTSEGNKSLDAWAKVRGL